MPPKPRPFPVRPLVVAFIGIMAVFVTTVAGSQYWVYAIDAPARRIASETAPAIEHLTAARAELRRLQAYVTAYAFASPDRRTRILPAMEAAERGLDRDLDAYLHLPGALDHPETWSRVREALRQVNADAERVEYAVQNGSGAQARETVLVHFVDEVDAAGDALLEATTGAAQTSHALAGTIRTLRERALWSAVVFGLLGSLFAVVAIFTGVRIVRSHGALLEEHNRLLARRASELEVFSARVAHDIVSPLSAVSLGLDSLGRRHDADERSTRVIARARSSLSRVQGLVHDLLDFARSGARPEAGATSPVATVVREVVAEIGPEADRHGIDLAVDGALPEGVQVACAPGLLASLVSNLTRNAVKHMGDAPERRVRVRALDEGVRVRLEVEDTGPGLPPDAEGWVFDPYARGNEETPGLGLGLATVRRLAEAHGGEVGLSSQLGAGARFWVALPKAPALPAAGTPARAVGE